MGRLVRYRLLGPIAATAAAVAMMWFGAPGAAQAPPTAAAKAPPTAAAKAPPTAKKGPPVPQGPTPRMANGRADFSGVWRPGDIFLIEDIALGLKSGDTVPLNDWGKQAMSRHLSKDDPEANCLPTGVPRHAPYPWKIVETPPYIYFLFEGNIHSFRQIFMDGRAHPKDPNPTWYGHSVGKWEGDTLVVDSVGFNDKFWFDFVGHPHTEQLHTIERYTRKDLGTLLEEVTIDDPGAYTKPFTIYASHRLLPGDELLEYICQENQRDTQHLIGPAGAAVTKLVIITALLALAPAHAQWLDFPSKGIPRLVNGKANLSAPTPRTADGHPDLTGLWVADNSRHLANLAADLKEVPFQPWAEKLYNERRAQGGKDDPEARCLPQGVPKVNTLPYPFKVMNQPGEVVILYEMYYLYRQIFTDGRDFPKEFLSPSWMGYSIGKWDGDDFVVTTTGVNEDFWMDTFGHPHTSALKVTERFRRLDFGHMEAHVTIDDPKAYTKPWGAVIKQHLLPDTELLEFVCEKNLDPQHFVGK